MQRREGLEQLIEITYASAPFSLHCALMAASFGVKINKPPFLLPKFGQSNPSFCVRSYFDEKVTWLA